MDRKEAIEVVRKKVDYYEADKRLKAALEALIPELVESEDERMRKIITKFVWGYANTPGAIINGDKSVLEYAKEVGAYLEKQKEQQPVPALDIGDEIILKAICDELKDAPGWVERIEGWYRLAKDAQQPVKNTPICGDAAKKYFDSWIEKHRDSSTKWGCFWEGILYSGKLQKPAEWNEEDKKMLDKTVENLTELKDRFGKCYGRVGDCIAWLKSRRPQAKQEQTAEEKEYVRTIKSLVADAIRLAECNEVKDGVLGEIIAQSGPNIDFYQRLIDWVEGRHVYQSAEWSEEDEKQLNWFYRLLDFIGEEFPSTWGQNHKGGKEWLKYLRPQPNNNLRWRRAKAGENIPESIILPDGDDPRFGKCAVMDSYYIPISELKELPKE